MSPPLRRTDRRAVQPVELHDVLPRELLDLPPALSVEQVARLLRIGRNAAYEAVATGELPALRIGHRWVIPTVPILRLLGVEVGEDVTLKKRKVR